MQRSVFDFRVVGRSKPASWSGPPSWGSTDFVLVKFGQIYCARMQQWMLSV